MTYCHDGWCVETLVSSSFPSIIAFLLNGSEALGAPGPEWGETKEGFKCTSKKNSVPRNPKLRWLSAINPEKYPASFLPCQ